MARPPLRWELYPVYSVVKRCVDAWDPMGLIAGGAPPDEYECENRMLAGRIHPGDAAGTIAEAVNDVFSKMFWPEYFGIDKCRDVADKICVGLNELAERSL